MYNKTYLFDDYFAARMHLLEDRIAFLEERIFDLEIREEHGELHHRLLDATKQHLSQIQDKYSYYKKQ